jgi:hypothetical protein
MLSRQPDPVFVGETRSALALWSAGIFERFGITSFVHVRAIHYRVISQPLAALAAERQAVPQTREML